MSKDDELVRLRKDNERLLFEQRESNHQILEKQDKALENQLSKALEDKSKAEKQSELLSHALEELKNLRAVELFV